MSYLKFDKEQLVNLEYSLNREILRSNRAGSYISTTLNGCNTRKYHGLLVCPINNFGGEKHVLLSSLDVSLIQDNEEFRLGIHRYKGGSYDPKGHIYIENIELDYLPKISYRIGNALLTMERLLVEKKEQILIRYTLSDTTKETIVRFKPFLAFRNIHSLSKANLFVNSKFQSVSNGASMRLYDGYPDLFMQFNKKNDFIPVPDWYYNIEYLKELHRGYEYLEDLFVPGYFELSMKPGETVIFAAGTELSNPNTLKQRFTREQNKRTRRFTFLSSLKNACEQFVLQKKNETSIIAGFPWYNSITRQAFVALPGLALGTGKNSLFADVLTTYKKHIKNGLLPDTIDSQQPTYNSADASLWFIWAVQQYAKTQRSPRGVWLNYSFTVKEILEAYRNSLPDFLEMTSDGLLCAEKENTALTWMDSYSEGKPVVQRAGLAAEINALWYNAIVFALEMAKISNDSKFIKEWEAMPQKMGDAFLRTFCSEGHDHLADVVKDGIRDWAVRPNMVIAAAMDYSPLSKEQRKHILSEAKRRLLTPRGLRTLSPDHLRYKGIIQGGPDQRESAVHMGAAYPWLIQFFVKAYLEIHGRGGLPFVKQILERFEETVTEHCVGTLSETYNGDPPHKAKGATSQAWNVAGIVNALHLMQNCK
ncbi:glycogen debranching enzyme, putative [Mariniphaga anaerophila]|uniref:Glycogen debranching enzyme, putative n=1 Tax=Mariniphaga anaerophila TaxID=1484053 RepID=A0A1M4YNU1_9BACT|nr:amylo-alpha-1,6-glucosidase [Mariniphaga anaerophila]SHF07307.1 glycogen debranching enzyme, putative [Mariniphaga anaerophila]